MKRLWKILGVVVVLVVALVVAGVAILKSMDFNEYKALIEQEVESATGRQLRIAGDLEVLVSLTPAVAVDGMTFTNADWGSRPEMAKLDHFEAEMSLLPLLTGDIQVKRVVLEGVDVLLETDAQGRGNWEMGEAAPEAQTAEGRATALPVVHSVRLKDVRLTYRDGVTGQETRVTLDRLDVSADAADSPMKVAFEATYNDETFSGEGTLGAVDAFAANRVFPVTLDVAALGADVTVDGTVGKPRDMTGYNIGLRVAGSDLASTAGRAAVLAGAEVPPLAASRFVIAGAVRDEGARYAVDGLAVTVGESDLAGSLTADIGGRPAITADLTSTRLALSDFLAPAEDEAAAEPAADDGRVFPADPLPLDGLKAADAEVSLQAGTVVANGTTITDLATRVRLKQGRLAVDPLALVFGEGEVNGALTLDAAAATPGVAVRLDGRGVNYGKILREAGQGDLLDGKADLSVDVEGAGGSVRAIMAGLNGSVRLSTENGKIESNALNIVSADALSALPFMDSKGDKDLRCGVVDFRVKQGLASSHTILVETGGVSMIGEGTVNLADETLDLRLDPAAKKQSLLNIAEVPVDVTGTLKNPRFAPAPEAVAMGVAKAAAGFATGGLTTVVELAAGGLVSTVVDETDYCAIALAGKPVNFSTREANAPKSESSTGGAVEDAAKGASDAVKGIGEGLGGAVKGLFGD